MNSKACIKYSSVGYTLPVINSYLQTVKLQEFPVLRFVILQPEKNITLTLKT
jgi:hypothetical protein